MPHQPDQPTSRPSIAEITALTRRLRELADAGRDVDPAERERFLADKHALLHRITADVDPPPRTRRAGFAAEAAAATAVRDVARLRAAAGGYTVVGPSARTWHTDPDGRPTVAASDAEHRAVRALLQSSELDTTAPVWIDGGDGQSELVATVVVVADEDESEHLDDWRINHADVGGFVRADTPRQSSDRRGGGQVPSGADDERERREQLHRWDHDDDSSRDDTADTAITVYNPIVGEGSW